MKRLLYSAMSLILVAILNLFVFGGHSSAMSSGSAHSMGSAKHTKASQNCMTLCMSASQREAHELGVVDENEDKEPSVPFYTVSQQAIQLLEKLHTTYAKFAVLFEPPPGLPLYIQFATLRP